VLERFVGLGVRALTSSPPTQGGDLPPPLRDVVPTADAKAERVGA
jgi:hypothetical protein